MLRALCCFLLVSESAHGQGQPVSLTTRYSAYEDQAIRDAASALGTELDPAPQGKEIERVDFVRIEPIDPHDPAPLVLNRVHVTSRPSVLRHELLVREGSTWSDVLVDESARNLRLLPQLSLVLCVPMRGSSPDRVRLVVITKDVWSLYVDFDLVLSGGLQNLDLEPKETNFLGLHQTVLGRFVLTPDTYSLGASYQVPRFAGRFLSFSADANVILNSGNGSSEGHYGSVSVGRPLHSSLTEWAWAANVQWDDKVFRQYNGTQVCTWSAPSNCDAPGQSPTGPPPYVPWMYRQRTILEEAELVRSYGWKTKGDFSVGASMGNASYIAPQPSPGVDRTAIKEFMAAVAPRSEARVGPFVQWHGYSSDFLRITDFDTLALQEDYRLGHEVYLRVYPVLSALGSTRDFVGTYAAASYGARLGDGVARALVESTIEGGPDDIKDAYINAEIGVATPRLLGIGRLALDLTVLDRLRNYMNALSSLGYDSRLRGYPTQKFHGWDMVVSNLEFRFRPVEIASLQFAATAFYDVGDAFGDATHGFESLSPKQSVGVGLRVLFPQVTRSVLRIDLGVPLSGPSIPGGIQAALAPGPFVTFGQALGLPGPSPPGVGLPQ
jgi:hypothetical protein